MTKADIEKIGRLSGRCIFKSIAITADVAKTSVKVTDRVLGTAGSLAADFSGHKSSNIAPAIARGAANTAFDFTKRVALWGERKLRA